MERLYLETSEGKVSYLERKGDQPLIFLHGLGGSGNNWLKLAKFLPEKYRLLMPDLKGHGKSSREMAHYSVNEEVNFIAAFIKSLDLEGFSLIGNSYGGWVSMKFSATISKPENLVLVDSAGINPTVGESSQETIDGFVERVMKMNPKNDREIIRRFVVKNADGEEKLTNQELSQLPSSTLIVWGRKDRLIPVEYAENLNRSIVGSKLRIIEEGGHTPHATNAVEVAGALLEFLE